jgi:hypothetical protein
MQKARGRLVNFRVTDDELEQLKSACDRQGARCLSAFARQVMLSPPSAYTNDYDGKLAALDRRLSTLEVSMSRLSHALAISNVEVSVSQKQK